MRIGIITQPLRYNYGGLLQNFALQTILTQMGHEVITLDGEVKTTKTKKYVFYNFLKKAFSLFVDKDGRFLHIWKHEFTTDILSKNTRCFIDKYIKVKKIGHPKEVDYDALIVGSDQVWRPSYSNLDEAFLSFAKKWKKVKRVAYAASFGSEVWEYSEEETIKCKRLVSLFDAVSVREKSGVTLCKNFFGIDALHVLDPTLLLFKEDYFKILSLDCIKKSDGNLFYYFLDPNNLKIDLLQKAEKELGLKAFTVNSKVEDTTASLENRIQPPVEKWLRAFIDASFVVTDSFHGCVFSLIFNKPFMVIANSKRGRSRFESLLEMTHQQFRLIDGSVDSFKKFLEYPNVDLSAIKKYSIDFLAANLK